MITNENNIDETHEETDSDDKIKHELYKSGIYYFYGEIDNERVAKCIRWIIKENQTPSRSRKHEKLTLYINSLGGEMYTSFALVDAMLASVIPIQTIGIGAVMSAATFILAAGKKGERYISRTASLMTHQFSAETEGKEHDLMASVKDLKNIRKYMEDRLVEFTGLDIKVVRKKLLGPSDTYLTPAEAIKYGFADKILTSVKK